MAAFCISFDLKLAVYILSSSRHRCSGLILHRGLNLFNCCAKMTVASKINHLSMKSDKHTKLMAMYNSFTFVKISVYS